MKIEELKHNHSLTDLLKICLFSILMLAPIGMVATRCLYVIANKNAYQSYSGKSQNEYVEVTSTNELIYGDLYHFNSAGTYTNSSTQNTGLVGYSNLNNLSTININYQTYLANGSYFKLYYSTSIVMLYVFDENQTQIGSGTITNASVNFDFTLTAYSDTTISQNMTWLSKYDYANNATLDNVFEYSVSQLEKSNLFNWTKNTAIYSGINAMNEQLGINSPAITITLTYWLILTCIYVIIDIVLKLFTILTHFIGSKTSS